MDAKVIQLQRWTRDSFAKRTISTHLVVAALDEIECRENQGCLLLCLTFDKRNFEIFLTYPNLVNTCGVWVERPSAKPSTTHSSSPSKSLGSPVTSDKQ